MVVEPLDGDPLHASVVELDQLPRLHREALVNVVDLKVTSPLGGERAQLAIDEGGEVGGDLEAIAVGSAVANLCRERERPWQRDLERPVGRGLEVGELLHGSQAGGSGEPVDGLVRLVSVVGEDPHLAAGGEWTETGEIAEDRDDETLAAHLAVRDEVDARALLVAERHLDRVVLGLGGVHLTEAP